MDQPKGVLPMLANNFQQLTPEQEQQLYRDAVRPSMSPMEMMAVPVGGGLMAALYALARSGGLSRLTSAIGSGAAGATFIDSQHRRADSQRDAEGQPGGFYGNKR